jgi:hypothetical protein
LGKAALRLLPNNLHDKEKFMKKLFALALAAVLGAALWAPSSSFAASAVEFSGYVKVYHESTNNFNRQWQKPHISENFFASRLNLLVTFRPQEEVAVYWNFRGPDYLRWGENGMDPNRADNANLRTRFVYGEMLFPWGTIRGGLLADGLPGTVGGLATLGYAPTWGNDFLYAQVFDYNTPVHGLTYTNSWELGGGNKLGLTVAYEKFNTNYAGALYGTGFPPQFFARYPDFGPNWFAPVGLNKDVDYDSFVVEASYQWESGGVSLGLQYDRDKSDPAVRKDYAFFVNPAFVQSFGPFAIHFEGKVGWGKRTYDRAFIVDADWTGFEGYLGHAWNGTIENKGLGLYIDGTYTYDQGDVTLAGWYISGTDLNKKRGSLNNLVDTGDFAPFLVAYYGTTMGTDTIQDVLGSSFNGQGGNVAFNVGTKNHWAVGIMGNHTIIPDFIKMNYGIGYFQLVKPTHLWAWDGVDWNQGVFVDPALVNTAVYRNQSKDLGWEIDVGFTFQIFESVYFETEFGYFFNGSAFDTWDSATHTWKSAKDTFAWENVLAFNF